MSNKATASNKRWLSDEWLDWELEEELLSEQESGSLAKSFSPEVVPSSTASADSN